MKEVEAWLGQLSKDCNGLGRRGELVAIADRDERWYVYGTEQRPTVRPGQDRLLLPHEGVPSNPLRHALKLASDRA